MAIGYDSHIMITTERLELVPGTVESVRAAIDDLPRLGALLRAAIPPTWPPDLLDRDALEWTLRVMEAPTFDPRWGFYWVVLRSPRTLIGAGGFKGNPVDGGVELGYGIVSDHRRMGFATEMTRGLVRSAFETPGITSVFAETLPGLVASIGVLDNCGFSFIGDGSEPGVIRYELRRPSAG